MAFLRGSINIIIYFYSFYSQWCGGNQDFYLFRVGSFLEIIDVNPNALYFYFLILPWPVKGWIKYQFSRIEYEKKYYNGADGGRSVALLSDAVIVDIFETNIIIMLVSNWFYELYFPHQ